MRLVSPPDWEILDPPLWMVSHQFTTKSKTTNNHCNPFSVVLEVSVWEPAKHWHWHKQTQYISIRTDRDFLQVAGQAAGFCEPESVHYDLCAVALAQVAGGDL